MTKAHKIEIYPTAEQEIYFFRACGAARRAFNWALGMYNLARKKGAKTTPRRLRKAFTRIKPEWYGEVTSQAYQGAFKDLNAAIERYFDQKKKGNLVTPEDWKGRKDHQPFGWPQFKARRFTTPAFYLANTVLKFKDKWFQFDKRRCGWVKMAETKRFEGEVRGARVRYEGGRWWLSIQIRRDEDLPNPPEPPDKIIGVDLGVRYLATTSMPVEIDGQAMTEIVNPKPLIAALRKLRRLQRHVDRQRRANNPDNFDDKGNVIKGSKNWVSSNRQRRIEKQITALHFRVKSIRANASHKLTKALATQGDVVVIEDLNVAGMLKNGKLAKHIQDAAFYEKRRQLGYKTDWYGARLVVVDRWYPSSKTCSGCDWINAELKSETRWICPECGQVNERDQNAAVNLAVEGGRLLSEAK